MSKTHTYDTTVTWTGNRGTGTSGYRDYDRTNNIDAPGRPTIAGTSDPAFRGDPTRWNPEQLLVASLSQCHMLWFLHLAAQAGIIVTAYTDNATGTMAENPDGSGQFTEVALRPAVTLTDPAMTVRLGQLHHEAHEKCFISRSVNFPVTVSPAP